MKFVEHNFQYFSHFKHIRHFSLLILGTFHLSALLTLLSCSKPNTTQPEPQRPQIEVTEDITEDTVWESGKDYGV